MSLGGREVLIVDDEPFSRAIIHAILRELGVGFIHQARNGADAAEMLSVQGTIDCVVSDFNMPVVNGLQLLKGIRTGFRGLNPATPMVLLTGNADTALVGAAMALDVNGFIVKPASQLAMKTRLEAVFAEPFQPRDRAVYAAVAIGKIAASPALTTAIPMRQLPLAAVPVGSVLAKPFAINGVPVIQAGFRLTARVLAQLRELASMPGADSGLWLQV